MCLCYVCWCVFERKKGREPARARDSKREREQERESKREQERESKIERARERERENTSNDDELTSKMAGF